MTGCRRTVFRGCTLCEASCGLALELEGDRISVRGDEEDPLSHGFICAKGVAIADLHHDPDRLRSPMRKTAEGKFEPIGWEEAFAIVGARLKALRATPRRRRDRALPGQPDHPQPRRPAAAGGFRSRVRHPQQLQRGLAGYEPALRGVFSSLRVVAGHPGARH